MDSIERIREIIEDNNWFDTPSGERFREMYGVNRDVTAVIAFAGRSKRRESYLLPESDEVYVTHLMITEGRVVAILDNEDTDDYGILVHSPARVDIEDIDEEILEEWVELLEM